MHTTHRVLKKSSLFIVDFIKNKSTDPRVLQIPNKNFIKIDSVTLRSLISLMQMNKQKLAVLSHKAVARGSKTVLY